MDNFSESETGDEDDVFEGDEGDEEYENDDNDDAMGSIVVNASRKKRKNSWLNEIPTTEEEFKIFKKNFERHLEQKRKKKENKFEDSHADMLRTCFSSDTQFENAQRIKLNNRNVVGLCHNGDGSTTYIRKQGRGKRKEAYGRAVAGHVSQGSRKRSREKAEYAHRSKENVRSPWCFLVWEDEDHTKVKSQIEPPRDWNSLLGVLVTPEEALTRMLEDMAYKDTLNHDLFHVGSEKVEVPFKALVGGDGTDMKGSKFGTFGITLQESSRQCFTSDGGNSDFMPILWWKGDERVVGNILWGIAFNSLCAFLNRPICIAPSRSTLVWNGEKMEIADTKFQWFSQGMNGQDARCTCCNIHATEWVTPGAPLSIKDFDPHVQVMTEHERCANWIDCIYQAMQLQEKLAQEKEKVLGCGKLEELRVEATRLGGSNQFPLCLKMNATGNWEMVGYVGKKYCHLSTDDYKQWSADDRTKASELYKTLLIGDAQWRNTAPIDVCDVLDPTNPGFSLKNSYCCVPVGHDLKKVNTHYFLDYCCPVCLLYITFSYNH
jgi:hypothetical protein